MFTLLSTCRRELNSPFSGCNTPIRIKNISISWHNRNLRSALLPAYTVMCVIALCREILNRLTELPIIRRSFPYRLTKVSGELRNCITYTYIIYQIFASQIEICPDFFPKVTRAISIDFRKCIRSIDNVLCLNVLSILKKV